MGKITTADCVKWIVENAVPTSKVGDWKRTRKYKVGEEIMREFASRRDPNIVVTVAEWNGKIGPRVSQEIEEKEAAKLAAPTPKTSVGANPRWDAIRENSATVDLKRVEYPKREDYDEGPDGDEDFENDNRDREWSGRVIFGLGEMIEEGEMEHCDGEVGFYCGPEDRDGSLEDTLDGGVGDKLKTLFLDLDISIMDAENFHTASLVPGITAKELWGLIVERLERSGAVKQSDEFGGEE